MLIGIDGNEANVSQRVGIGQYAYHVLLNLHRLNPDNLYRVYLKNPPLSDLPTPKTNWSYFVFGPQKLWTKLALPLKLLTQPQLDIFYSPGHYLPSISFCPLIPTIHDLGYLQFPNQFTPKDYYQLKNWTESSLKKAYHLIAVSRFTKSELNRIYRIPLKKISLAYNGVGEIPKTSPKILSKFNIPKKYFLYLGTLKPNKNIPFLIKSFALFLKSTIYDLRSNISLVIAGKKGWLYNEIFQTVVSEDLQSNVIFTDFISEPQKWALYQNAVCTILPSTYEGFGIPALESMKCGTPVIVSQIPPFREVVDQAGLTINPNDSADLIDKMVLILQPKIHQKYSLLGLTQASKFTWENTAKSIHSVFAKIKS